MKRHGNLYHKVYDMTNLRIAAKKAMRGKSRQKGVIEFKKDPERYLWQLHYLLRNKEYKTSAYKHFQIKEEKIRDISSLPFFPDRVAHQALMAVVDPIIIPTLVSNTYNCIKNRGILKATFALRKGLKDVESTLYCLKMDIKKFYPSVDTEILKQLLRRKIKDNDLLWLLDEIIGSHSGLPLGNYPSQNLANFYLSPFDHYLKQDCGVKYAYRFCDDYVILDSSKEYLHDLLTKIKIYLKEKLNLTVKSNHQIFPVSSRMIDFVGYPVDHNNVRLRPGIKKRFKIAVHKNKYKSIPSFLGWAKWANCRHLEKKLLNNKI